tara:strand:- start:992 stop:1243 length:252 start_codon:yes stop_codon:yes gene_type:complete
MKFHVFQSSNDPNHYVVTDEGHMEDGTTTKKYRLDKMIDLGSYAELGDRRVAFNEQIAKGAIRSRGAYEFDATSGIVTHTPGV